MIQIDEMILRIPGLSEEDASSIGSMVGKKLSERMGENTPDGKMDALKITVNPQNGSKPAQVADAIVEQILSQLKIASL